MLASIATHPGPDRPTVRKSLVFVPLALAIVVLVSPRIVGHLAEQAMDENLDWAAAETGDLRVTALGFDRGWFSSGGQHRVEVKPGELHDSLLALMDDGGAGGLPALVITTHIDHGLVPLSSIGRERGSLVPGLGSAVSRLSLEFAGGRTAELPGTVYSRVGLTGTVESNLVIEPGSFEVGAESAHWGNVDLLVTSRPAYNAFGFSGSIDDLALVSASNEVGLRNAVFGGEQQQTRFGFAVGNASLEIEAISFPADFGRADTGPWRFTSAASLDGDLVSVRTTIDTDYVPLGDAGPTGFGINVSVEGADAAALGRISKALDDFGSYGSGDALMLLIEDDLEKLVAAGFRVRVDRFDIAMPPGTIAARLDLGVAPTVIDGLAWAAVLPALDATFDLSLPVEFYDYLVMLDPQVSTAAAMGFLVRKGDVYRMEAVLANGRLTINGAPMPLALPGGN